MSNEQPKLKSEASVFHDEWAGFEMIGDITTLPLDILETLVEDPFEL